MLGPKTGIEVQDTPDSTDNESSRSESRDAEDRFCAGLIGVSGDVASGLLDIDRSGQPEKKSQCKHAALLRDRALPLLQRKVSVSVALRDRQCGVSRD